ncbi:hypothetical protein SAMN02745823_02918 [Sporobacter termitidis DSM 10068]|uniref:Uncharacterized protein n=1 Tax=Sporobacter termitidis DSM 10068 TaxID=1123282 RepID=A0A1M5YW90_9FIRM|nr:hypothetical protein [Sporobacter termitidis]SHI16332.1 hypothetical protein SAMN02745823_02918 [Sporobacter termitidis DSM 10068]
METIYQEYLKLNIDGSLIGLERGADENNYFCTPEGAGIIGWAGVDGIHFCFVRGFGEMVFAVSPMNAPGGSYVHPLARDFKDFLRLLLACGHTAALEQAWCWEQEQFDEFLRKNAPADEQSAALHILREKMSLTPMAQPFAYIKALQDGFDYRTIPYTEDYYDAVHADSPIPEWKVYFDGSFWGHHGRERAGTEISLNRQIAWEDEVWTVPAIYACGKGLIVDFCLQVPAERIRAFPEQWNLSADGGGAGLTVERRMRIDAENPLAVNINPTVVLNGAELSSSHGCGLCWNPCLPEGNGLEAWSVMRHYGLDLGQGYVVWRGAFPWKTKRRPQIKTLGVRLAREPVSIPGPRFRVSLPGAQMALIHPSTGESLLLTVREYERRELSAEHFNDPDLEFPRHLIMMSYTLSPDLPDQAFTVEDCAPGDRPRQKHTDPRAPQATGDVCCIGIIGSADAAAAIVLGNGNQGKLRAACSALHFEPAKDVEWRMIFYEKTRRDIMAELL